MIPDELDRKKTGLRWKKMKPKKYKFVDDGMIVSKINMDTAYLTRVGTRSVKTKHDVQSQNLFRRIVARATSRGMVVNNGKTKLLCISDAQTYKPEAFILDRDGERLEAGEDLKVLGFHFDSRPTCHVHIGL